MKQKKLIPKFQTASGYFRYLNNPEFMARMAARYGTVPGTNVNSEEEQNSKQRTQRKKKDENTRTDRRTSDQRARSERQERNRQHDQVVNNVADALNTIGTVSGLGALGMGLTAAPAATVGGLFGSIAGEKPVDALTNYLVNSNKSKYPYLLENNEPTTFNKWASEKTGLSENMVGFLNPGAWIGGSLGGKAGQTVRNVAPSVARLFASPYTGRWTQFGNREYRFRPGYAAVNGVPLDSRPVSQATERSLINQQGIVSTNRARRALAQRGALDLYTNENIGEFFPLYDLTIQEHSLPGYRPFLGITGPRSRLYALQHDVDAKLSERGAEPLRIIEPNGFINREQRYPMAPRPTTTRQPLPEPPREIIIDRNNFTDNDAAISQALRTRESADIAQLGRYTYNDIFYPNGMPKVDLSNFRRVHTGAHGDFINMWGRSEPEEVFEKLVRLRENPQFGRNEVTSIRRESHNKPGSGIIVHTHNGDLSVDSHQLANVMQSSLGKEAYRLPLEGESEMVVLNNLGYKSLFVEPNRWEISPELMDKLRANYAQYGRYIGPNMSVIQDVDGSLIVKEGGNSVGKIGVNSPEQVQNKIDKRIKLVNDKYNLNYPNSQLRGSGPYNQWTFNREIYVPNQKHIILKDGGSIIKRFKNDRRKKIF